MLAMCQTKETSDLLSRLPAVRGKLRAGAVLAKTNWFGVGGPAEVLFRPADEADLAQFLKALPEEVPVTVVGIGSNLLVRDGGLDGVVIKLGSGFTEVTVADRQIIAGAGAPDIHVAQAACSHGLAGLEFLSGIPGAIGGALRMNAGAYGREVKDVLVSARAVDRQGNIHILSPQDMQFSYRKTAGVPEGWIFTEATFKGQTGKEAEISAAMKEIAEARSSTQPVKSRTGGSTFKNPEGHKAWQLVDAAGCRGLRVGGAVMSEKHCNFMINEGNATAADLEGLGEEVRRRVKEHSGIELAWEIRRIGKEAGNG